MILLNDASRVDVQKAAIPPQLTIFPGYYLRKYGFAGSDLSIYTSNGIAVLTPCAQVLSPKMPTVEDYFDDDTDLPLPSSSKPRGLGGSGLQGALLEEIGDGMEMDYDKLAEQGRGIFGEDSIAPPPSAAPVTPSGKGKMSVRDDGTRPVGPGGAGGPRFDPNSPMGGFMGDMMKLQQAEEDRLERLKKQFGNATIADPSIYKKWVRTPLCLSS